MMNAENIKIILIGLVLAGFFFDKFSSWLNVRQPVPPVPDNLKGYLDQAKLLEAKSYQKVNFRFGMFSESLSLALMLVLLILGAFGELDTYISGITDKPLIQSLLFFGILFIASDLLSLPFDYYHTFRIEEDYGFNKTSPRTFFLDKIKGYALALVVGGGLLTLLIWLIATLGSGFWLYFWLVAAVFMVVINRFYTSLILPLFNKLSPLEEGELKSAIMHYADQVDFPLTNVYVIDGSTRSTKANAFFSGFGKQKKVVLYDTLIEQHTVEELVAVLVHEVGHFKKKHILQSMLLSVLQVGIILYAMSIVVNSEQISMALGGARQAIHLNLLGYFILFSPISSIMGIGMNMLSRKNEFEADAFAKSTYSGPPLAAALKTLSVKTLSQINPHPLQVFIKFSHPPLLQRLKKLEA
ncbi:peptidase M48 [Echinicola pacifica]|uniref:Peptidase M48 n=2 Tax=Echinicola pacifica TaxID=346377 RepID=A0A918UUX2_9BACT|nr:M48 family metallopeptidase [Echinicola pacifica]GGZ36079.1 peptidase M48 [Echinicola pacifica]